MRRRDPSKREQMSLWRHRDDLSLTENTNSARLVAMMSPHVISVGVQLAVSCIRQGRSVEEARANLAETLALYFEDQDVEIGEAPIIAPAG